ncbi:MAG: hypothetical protein SGPRY_007004 [Prymnesium sp.]
MLVVPFSHAKEEHALTLTSTAIDPDLIALATGAAPSRTRHRITRRPSSAPPARPAKVAIPSPPDQPPSTARGEGGGRVPVPLSELEKLRRQQNEALLLELEREQVSSPHQEGTVAIGWNDLFARLDRQEREIDRQRLIARTPSGPDHKRLLKLLELERTKANREIKRMAEDHELELARYS